MAYKNKIISNPKTGQDIKFLQLGEETEGSLLEMESTYHSRSKEPAPHYHPYQSEVFEVISGELTVKIGGKIKVLKQGDTLHIPSNQTHSMWNNSAGKTIVNWKVQPAMETAALLETIFGLATEGRTNESGMPALLQMVLTANRYSKVLRLSKPPFVVQKLLFTVLTPFAYLMNYRPTYKKFLQ